MLHAIDKRCYFIAKLIVHDNSYIAIGFECIPDLRFGPERIRMIRLESEDDILFFDTGCRHGKRPNRRPWTLLSLSIDSGDTPVIDTDAECKRGRCIRWSII